MCFWSLNNKRNFFWKNVCTSNYLLFCLLAILLCMIEFVNIYPREFGIILKHMDLIYSFFAVESEGRVVESSRFRFPKSTEQERSILIDSIPKKNTRQNTKWAVKVFEDWQHARKNKDVIKEKVGFGQMDLATIQHVTCRIEHMLAETLNFGSLNLHKSQIKVLDNVHPKRYIYTFVDWIVI